MRLPAPQLRALSTKKDPNLGSFFVLRPHEADGQHEVLDMIASTPLDGIGSDPSHLQSSKKENWLYKGSTSDLKRRLQEHNAGKNFSTAPFIPFKLIYDEAYLLKTDAEAREKYLKTSMGMRVIKKQLTNYLKH